MYMDNGRAKQVGRGDNRPLGFYGVGNVGATFVGPDGLPVEIPEQTGSGEGGPEGTGFPTGSRNNSSGESGSTTTSSTFIPNSDGTYYDVLTGLTVNPKTGATSSASKASTGSGASYLLIAAGVVGLLIMFKR